MELFQSLSTVTIVVYLLLLPVRQFTLSRLDWLQSYLRLRNYNFCLISVFFSAIVVTKTINLVYNFLLLVALDDVQFKVLFFFQVLGMIYIK